LVSTAVWARDLLTRIPDGHYELKFFAADEADIPVAAVAIFHGTHTGTGGPMSANGNKIAAESDLGLETKFQGWLGRPTH